MDEYKKLQEELNNIVKSEHIIYYYQQYVKITNSITAGIMLGHLVSLSQYNKEFCRTDEELCKELCFSIFKLIDARDILKELGFIQVSRKGTPAKTYYKINYYNIIDALKKEN